MRAHQQPHARPSQPSHQGQPGAEQHQPTSPPPDRSGLAAWGRWSWRALRAGCVLLWVCLGLMGCPRQTKKARDPKLPKSDQPIVKLAKHSGPNVSYYVYNTSGRTFIGLAVVFDGDDCDGPRSRQFSVQIDAKPLHKNIRRPLKYKLPYPCRSLKLSAYDLPTFRRKIFKEHQPFTRFKRAGNKLRITIQNRSVIPFRGVAVIVKGNVCEGPKPKHRWVLGFKRRLYPGHERVESMTLPVKCENVDVDAMDLMMFIKRQAILRKKQRQLQKKLREGAKKLFKGF